MSNRIVNPYQQFLDDLGFAVANGTITLYENGSVTVLKDAFTDSTNDTAISNPYTLDAAGRVIGDAWLEGLYTIVLKDSAGATIRQIDDVGVAAAAVSVDAEVNNKVLNGGMRVAFGADVAISSAYQVGKVSVIQGKATNSSTGTITQSETGNAGTTGFELHLSGVTTGAGGQVFAANDISSENISNSLSGDVSVSAKVYHDTGVSHNWQLNVYSADAKDDFSTVTLISSTTAVSVTSAVATTLTGTFDLSGTSNAANGIRVEVQSDCGAVTTKNFYIAEMSVNNGRAVATYSQQLFEKDVSDVVASGSSDSVPVLISSADATVGATMDFFTAFSDNTGFTQFRIYVEGISPDAVDTLGARFSIDGSTVESGASDYEWAIQELHPSFAPANAQSTADTGIRLAVTTTQPTAFVEGTIDVARPALTDRPSPMKAQLWNTVTSADLTQATGQYSATNDDLTGFQLYWRSGNNFQSVGTIKVYGSNAPF